MTKKIIYSFLLAIALIGCGGDSSSANDKTSNDEEPQQEETQDRTENNQSNEVKEISLKNEKHHIPIKADIKYLNTNNIQKIIDLLSREGYSGFINKTVNTVYSDLNENGKEYYVITFNEDGYILLDSDINANAIYAFSSNESYTNVPKEHTVNVSMDWMLIIAEEVTIPFSKLKKSYQKVDRKLITKITWTSGSERSDFDLYVKSADGQICNWQSKNNNREAWGTKHLRDDRGGAYKKSFEAYSVDLNKMDEYATNNNLFGRDNGNYRFYIARYTGPNINYNFSYGFTGECSTDNANDCSRGNWSMRVNKTGINNAVYAVRYTPKKVSTSTSIELGVLSGGTGIGKIVSVNRYGTETGMINCSTSNNENCINTINSSEVILKAIPSYGTKFTGWGGACKEEYRNTCTVRGNNMSIQVAAGFELSSNTVNSSINEQLNTISFMEIVGATDSGTKIIRRISGIDAARKYSWIRDVIASNRSGNLRGMIIHGSSHRVYKFAGKAGKALGNFALVVDFGTQFLGSINNIEAILNSNNSYDIKSSRITAEITGITARTLGRIVPSTVNGVSSILRATKWINPTYWADCLVNDGRRWDKNIDFMDNLMNDMVIVLDEQYSGNNIYQVITVKSDKLVESLGMMNN